MASEIKSGSTQEQAVEDQSNNEPNRGEQIPPPDATVNTHLGWDSIKTGWDEYKQKVGL